MINYKETELSVRLSYKASILLIFHIQSDNIVYKYAFVE